MRNLTPTLLTTALVAAFVAVFITAPEWVDVYADGTLLLLSGALLIRSRRPGAVQVSSQVAGGFFLLFAGSTIGSLQRVAPSSARTAVGLDLVPGALCIAAFVVLFRAYLRSSAEHAAEPVAAPDGEPRDCADR